MFIATAPLAYACTGQVSPLQKRDTRRSVHQLIVCGVETTEDYGQGFYHTHRRYARGDDPSAAHMHWLSHNFIETTKGERKKKGKPEK